MDEKISQLATTLLGTPFQYGGRGPDQFDCYGLIMHMLKEVDDIVIPDYKSPSEGAKITALFAAGIDQWRETTPRKGAVALMKIPGNMHVGYCIGGGRMIHVWERSNGVCIERLEMWKHKIVGYYEYVG